MKKTIYLCGLLFLSTLLFSACSDDDGGNGGKTPGGEGPGIVSGVMTDLQITGHVRDIQGNPLSGVEVSSGTSVVKTNSSGMFSFSKVDVVNDRSLIRFAKEGYFDVVRSLNSDDGDWDVVMCEKGDGAFTSTTTYSSETGQSITSGGMRIDMPENGYMVDETGKAYTGAVKADMIYLDPNNENFAEMMPGGDLAATRTDGSAAMLVSYGMTAVNMTDATGRKLQLKEGSKATLTFPIPEGMTENLPETIPLWSFNETNGLWEEEGSARLQGNVYVGEVSHFSWVNLDYPEDEATIKGYVRNSNGRSISGVRVNVGQISVQTDASGYYETKVPAGSSFELKVKSESYGNYRNVFARPVPALEAKEEREVNITLPSLHRVYGRIVNQGGGSKVASIWIEYGNNNRLTRSVTSNPEDGVFTTYAPDGYTGPAVVKVLDNEGNLKTVSITLGNADTNLGDIIISSVLGSGGKIDVKLANGNTVSFDVPNGGEESMSGVVVLDDRLMYLYDEGNDQSALSIDINGYKEGKSDYENATVGVQNSIGDEVFVADGSAKINLTEKNKKFVFNMSGKGSYYNSYTGDYDENAMFTSEGLTLDLFFKGNTLRNIDPLKSGFPSFTPVLSQKSPLAVHIKDGKMCTNGGIVYYNGTKSDYDALKAKASKSGVKYIDEDSDGEYYEVVYFSNKRYIMIEFDSTVPPISDTDNFFEMEDAPIIVTVFDGVSQDFISSMMSDSRSRSFPVTAKRAVKKLR